MEYLGFQVTRDGVKLMNRKIEAINNMNPPTYQKEVQNFIGVVPYYPNICPRWSLTLAPLNILKYIKRKFKWDKIKQDAFDEN